MTGSGSDSFSSISDTIVACERLIIETAISSPKEAVITNLKAGDILQVKLEDVAGSSVVALYSNGQKAGGITHASTNRLRECIREGTTYEATVISKSDGQVRVRIKPV
jgi:acetamidase/formamidase